MFSSLLQPSSRCFTTILIYNNFPSFISTVVKHPDDGCKMIQTCIRILIYGKAYFISVCLLVYHIGVNIPYCRDMEHLKEVTNLHIYVPWAFSFLQHLSACYPLLDTYNVMHAQKHLFDLLQMLQKTVIWYKIPSVILWARILQNESYSLLMGHNAYVCRLP